MGTSASRSDVLFTAAALLLVLELVLVLETPSSRRASSG